MYEKFRTEIGTSTGFSIFSVAPLILYSIFLVCEAFHIKKVLGDCWNLRDRFTKLKKFVVGFLREQLKHGKKITKFVNVSPINLMNCIFIPEKNVHLANVSPRTAALVCKYILEFLGISKMF